MDARAGGRNALPVLLALVFLSAGCGATGPAGDDATEVPASSAADASTPVVITPTPTEVPTLTPSLAPSATTLGEGLYGPTTPGQAELMELMPAELNGVPGFVTPGGGIGEVMEAALAELGLDPADADVAWATYEPADGLLGAVMAFRVPGLNDLEALERALIGVGLENDIVVERAEVSGKTVLRFSDEMGAYVAEGATFFFAARDAELAEELIGKLP